jgi:deoxycytidylate deaminase
MVGNAEDSMSKALDAAVALAALSRCRTRVGAVLVKNGQVIAASPNIIKGW